MQHMRSRKPGAAARGAARQAGWRRFARPRWVVSLLALLVAVLIAAGLTSRETPVSAQGVTPRLAVSSSSPIAITSDNRFVWSVNPDNDSVSVFNVTNDLNQKVAEIPVGDEPQSVAITPDNRFVYVSNQVSGTVSVLNAVVPRVEQTIPVGTEPHGIALTADGRRLYVANMGSGDVDVIDTRSNEVVRTVDNAGQKPFAISITTSGPETVYVTQLLGLLRNDNRSVVEKEGRDDGKEGRVTIISTTNDRVVGTVALSHLADTGFVSDGSTLDRVPLAQGNVPVAGNANNRATGAFPNLLEGVAIKGNKAYVVNTASSPNGPFRFNVNVQGLISVFDVTTNQDANQTLNMNRGVQFEPVGVRLFNTTPNGIVFKRNANEGFVTLGSVNRLVRVTLDANGAPSIGAPTAAGAATNIVRVAVGDNPRGVVLNSTDTRAYVMNYVSRDVSVVDIQTGSANQHKELARIRSAALPTPGSLAAVVHRGKLLFNTGIGPAGTDENARPPAGRMSDFGWGSCYNCHPNGLQDGVTWMFPDGPRQTIPLDGMFAHPQPATLALNAFLSPVLPAADQRVLNWSAVRDENQDFELNIRAVSGGQGLIQRADGSRDPCVFNLVANVPAPVAGCGPETGSNTGRSADLDAITAYIAFDIRAPITPGQARRPGLGNVQLGRLLFQRANCQSCHGGVKWTRSRVDFTPPPDTRAGAEVITAGQLVRFLKNVGTFDPNAFNELRANQAANTVANGALGFNIPSLIGVGASAPYLHNGAAQTLAQVLTNPTHRAAGTPGVDVLFRSEDREHVVRFLETIDASTPIFP